MTQTITVDDTIDPTFDLPGDITRNADAGGCTLTLTAGEIGWPSNLSDNCSATGDITVTWTRSDAATNLDDPFSGTTTITWRVEDECGNYETNVTLTVQTITVLAFNTFVIDVQLEGDLYDPNAGSGDTITRCILFEFDCNVSVPVWDTEVLVTFSVDDDGTNGYSTMSPAQLVVDLPCGSYTCVTAEDELHSLRVTLTPSISGGEWVASFTVGNMLTQGDLYDDNLVDIVDFGTFIAEWGWTGSTSTTCSTAWPHSDIDADGAIGSADYAFIASHFLWIGDLDCCGSRDAFEPLMSITVRELVALGLPEWVDLTGDGVLDSDDIVAFMNGTVPEIVDPSGVGSDKAELNDLESEYDSPEAGFGGR